MVDHLKGNHSRCPIAGEGKCRPGEEWAEIGFVCKYLRPDETSRSENRKEYKFKQLVCTKSIEYLENYVKTNARKESIMFYGMF